MKKTYIETGRTNQKLETREKILVSAQYFLKNGQKLNLEDVAKKSGISRATIYRYFSNVEILANEATLAISTKSPETINTGFEDKTLEQKILGIQDYFNELSLHHEHVFRTYLSNVIVSTSTETKRGARRNKTLDLALANTSLSKKEKKDLSNLLTVLMGIEPIIVSKDVSGLNNQESKALLKWGTELILKGFFGSK